MNAEESNRHRNHEDPTSQSEVLERLSRLRKRIAARAGKPFDADRDLERLRQDRLDHILGDSAKDAGCEDGLEEDD